MELDLQDPQDPVHPGQPPYQHVGITVGSGDHPCPINNMLPLITPSLTAWTMNPPDGSDRENIIALVNGTALSLLDNGQDISTDMLSLAHFTSPSNSNAEDNRTTAFRYGAHLALYRAMNRFPASSIIQRIGCNILEDITHCGADDYRMEIIKGGGLDCCVKALKRHIDDWDVQKAGLELICALCHRGKRAEVAAREGVFDAVVGSMNYYKESKEAQGLGCATLNDLLYPVNADADADAAVKAGCIPVVVAAMIRNLDEAQIQVHGCRILDTIAHARREYCDAIIMGQALLPVVEALRLHKGRSDIQKAVFSLILMVSSVSV